MVHVTEKNYPFAVFIKQLILGYEFTLPTKFTGKSKLSTHLFVRKTEKTCVL